MVRKTPPRTRRRWWANEVRRRLLSEGRIGRRLAGLLVELELRQLRLLDERRRLTHVQDGYCRICGRAISARRLRLAPGAVLCSACVFIAHRSRDLLEPLARRN